jgi:ubiquinone/menaquinone biosynthesis C-methylase UbiE
LGFDELRHAGQEHLDPAFVAAYDRKARTDVNGDLEVLLAIGLSDRSTVMDIGAGTGTFALAAGLLCERVVAVDVSPAMLDALRAKLATSGLTNVECVRAGFLTFELPANTVDFAYSRNSLHHLPDFWKVIALRRIADVLRPGGVLRLRDLVYSFAPERADDVLETWLAQAPLNPKDGWTRQELETHIRDEHSTFSWLLERMLEQTGFAIEDVSHAASQVFSAYTCRKR